MFGQSIFPNEMINALILPRPSSDAVNWKQWIFIGAANTNVVDE